MWAKKQIIVSLSEPELGLGIIRNINFKNSTLEVFFKDAEESRTYSTASAPIQRFSLKVGDTFSCSKNEKHKVEKLTLKGSHYQYSSNSKMFWEYDIHANPKDQSGALDHLFAGNFSKHQLYDLRKDGWSIRSKALSMRVRGLVGARVTPLPHQIYIAYQVSRRSNPRVLLADEVGLGKTIEAGLIYSSMKSLGRADRVLIITPDSLIHQWMAETFRRFGDMFSVLNEERCLEEEASQGLTAFQLNQKCLVTSSFISNNPAILKQACNVKWDLIIVDEAHHLDWDENAPHSQWLTIQSLSKSTNGLLLLTATPRQHGLSTQFGLLNLVDPSRFNSFENFLDESDHMKQVAELSKDLLAENWTSTIEKQLKVLFKNDKNLLKNITNKPKNSLEFKRLINQLVDRHGTGRVLFRNRRERLKGFPKRQLTPVPLKPSKSYLKNMNSLDPNTLSDLSLIDYSTGRGVKKRSFVDKAHENPKYLWLEKYLLQNQNKKTLLICSNKEKVLEAKSYLDENFKNKKGFQFAIFHEDLSIVERDIQAANFASPKGPQLLLSSEIGGEGRNFQFSHKLIFLDLPSLPDLLEQRVGRLDRIGQQNIIDIYVPYLIDTPEEVLFNWFHKGLNSFETPWNGADSLLESFVEDLLHLFKCQFPQHKDFAQRSQLLSSLIEQTQQEAEQLNKERAESTDVLLDINSFDPLLGEELLEEIDDLDDDPQLEFFIRNIFDHYGIEYDEIDDRGSLVIRSDSLTFIDKFPGIAEDKDTPLTFDRKTALEREDYLFLSLDHTLVESCLGMLLDRGEGVCSICKWSNSPIQQGIILEIIVILEAKGPKHMELGTYLPLTVKEFRIDHNGSVIHRPEYADNPHMLEDMNEEDLPFTEAQMRTSLKPLLSKVLEDAEKWSLQPINEATEKANESFTFEIDRMSSLARINPSISANEVENLKSLHKDVLQRIQTATIRIDSLRVIFTS